MKVLVTAFALLLGASLQAQTLFHYGKDSVSAEEFLKAYRKNNRGPQTDAAFRGYLDLYIASRLKIREAKSLGYDTLPQLVADLYSLRQQILPTYLADKESTDRLVNEALLRSRKNIHLAHIFISHQPSGIPDSAAVQRKLSELQSALRAPGADFSALAKKYSDDPSAKNNGGDLGWITVFTLPYALENLAYNTAPGKVSAPLRTRAGYHIFKNLGERPDPGKVKAAQILLAVPPDSDAQPVKKLADSLYARLLKGDDFGKLAEKFSNDLVSAASGGQMQEIGAGEFDPVYEKQLFSLAKDGALSKPFQTAHGYHIVKRIGRKASSWDANDPKSMEALRQKVENSDRMGSTQAALANKILKQAGFQKLHFPEAGLWAFSDSIITYQAPARPTGINHQTALFRLGNETVTASDWIRYAQAFRYKPDGSGIKSYPQMWEEFTGHEAVEYYKEHLEEFNEEFRGQLNEFREGNLFFEIMQRRVWGPAQSDSTALADYFQRNRARYNWNRSADAVIFYASDLSTARAFHAELRKSPSDWREKAAAFSENIAADSSRFELDQIPNPGKLELKPGLVTSPLVNPNDNTASFALVVQVHEKGGERSFDEARGLVINDYQNELEQQWIAELKQKYPVRINEKVLTELMRKK